ncbi:hypothetical protein FCH28_10370 [Streptomyces piniterrae]|uniref:Uncharacterized protein n=1 Tax=Streptomyces piniterrae TaxID=2571125 RepID=A0A4U0NPA6_9ACTN|nr:hypothetical protein [Streptomyces piniterrae]TJZ55712.1 hypothetical protein FCH28_10370 [Streptomyces piniterrae]
MAAAVLAAAVPVATWGLLGRHDHQGVPPSELDHAVEPLDIPAGLEAAIGVVALLLVGACTALLVRASRRGTFDRRWWQVLGPLLVAGLVIGSGWRVLTAGVVGANIGAGLVIMIGGPVVAGLLLWAAGRGLWLARRSDPSDKP